jgi:hypothetical protein
MKLRSVFRLLGAAFLVTLGATAPALGATQHRSSRHRALAASASVGKVAVSGSTVTVSGRVRLANATAAQRKRARVVVTLVGRAGKTERRTAKLSASRTFRVRWKTKLLGRLTVKVRATVAGKPYGKIVSRRITVKQPAHTPIPTPVPGPTGGVPLIGTFKVDAGAAPNGQPPTGSYFEMLQSNGAPLSNLSSPAPDKDYTPLSPGIDGGLRTDVYQQAPNPAFSGGSVGGALADRIIQPVPFYLVNFSTETSSTDAQVGNQDPLPSIVNDNGQLSGQLTAWDAQWNGQSFNQGTPKPDGSVPPPTTPLTGTYEASSHRFTLVWKSLIVGGPFNGFAGLWHLSGTFVPVASASGMLSGSSPTH